MWVGPRKLCLSFAMVVVRGLVACKLVDDPWQVTMDHDPDIPCLTINTGDDHSQLPASGLNPAIANSLFSSPFSWPWIVAQTTASSFSHLACDYSFAQLSGCGPSSEIIPSLSQRLTSSRSRESDRSLRL